MYYSERMFCLDGLLIKAYMNSLNKDYDYIVAYLKYNSLKSPFVTSLTCSPAFTSSVRLSDLSALIWNMRGSTVPLSLFVLDVKLVSGSFSLSDLSPFLVENVLLFNLANLFILILLV